MPIIRANPGIAYWPGGAFRPNGRLVQVGATANPRAFESRVTWAGRLFVGFNVGATPKYTLDDLVRVVKATRAEHPDASFVAQKGIYTSVVTPGEVVTEDGGQVIIVNLYGASAREFEEEMVALGESIASALEQELVIVEIQRNGVVKKTIGVTPAEAA